jgi:starvation-inducible DNA-binding protein
MHKTRNDLPDNIRKAAIDLLQTRLADAVDLVTQAKQAHWNVKGPSFVSLHDLMDLDQPEVLVGAARDLGEDVGSDLVTHIRRPVDRRSRCLAEGGERGWIST